MPTYMVVYTTKISDGDSDEVFDYYTLHDTLAEAREKYDLVLQQEGTSIASIVAVIESTDYDTHLDLRSLARPTTTPKEGTK